MINDLKVCFEEWARKNRHNLSLEKKGETREYCSYPADCYWEAFLAGANAALALEVEEGFNL